MTFSIPVIFSCAGHTLNVNEQALFRDCSPFGFILFKRNIETPDQVRGLVHDLRAAVGWDCPVLIDQEGGRVQRLRPPHWPDYPAMKTFGDSVDIPALKETIASIARDLTALKIDVNCAPVLDVLFGDTHQAIGTRAFSSDPLVVARLGGIVCESLLAAGVTPVIKHIPGQGRATQDSHYDLPVVNAVLDDLAGVDFAPFRRVLSMPFAPHVWGMVSHIVYTALDDQNPATLSKPVIDAIRHKIGFGGLLLSDDLCMDALKTYGTAAERVVKTLEAGIDIALYCAGDQKDMEQIAAHAPPVPAQTKERYDRSRLPRR